MSPSSESAIPSHQRSTRRHCPVSRRFGHATSGSADRIRRGERLQPKVIDLGALGGRVARSFGLYDWLVLDVEDLVTPFLSFADRARRSPPPNLRAAWQTEIVEPRQDLFDSIREWVPPERADAALPILIEQATAWGDALETAADAAREAERLLAGVVDVGEMLPVTALVGVGVANGWAASTDGVPRLFLAVELLPRAPHDVVLALHEFVHVLHLRSGCPVMAAGPRRCHAFF